MIRALIEGILLFLLPFAGFAVLLFLQRRRVLHLQAWSSTSAWLAMAGLILVLASFVATGLLADRPQAGFEPTHMENGRVVPGRFR